MPELPEVETTRRGIEPHTVDQKILRVDIRESRLRWPISPELTIKLQGQHILSVTRRAKYLLFNLSNGNFMLHLGMSGSLRIVDPSTPLIKHDHVDLALDNNRILRYNDPRRFGSLLWLGDGDPMQHSLLAKLGPEPLLNDFDGSYLFRRSRKRTMAVKNFIMDGHIVVGVGNIYASEALFMSGIRPGRAAGRVTSSEYQLLAQKIKEVLQASIAMGGSTLRDFVGGDGKPGYFQQTLRVYGRQGQMCHTCSTAIKQKTIGQRSTFYCPACQR